MASSAGFESRVFSAAGQSDTTPRFAGKSGDADSFEERDSFEIAAPTPPARSRENVDENAGSSADADHRAVMARRAVDLPLDRFIEHLTEAGCFKLLQWARREAPDLLRNLMTAFVTAESSVTAVESRPTQQATSSTASSLKEAERAYIQRVLKESTTLREAASKLGINTVTLWRKRKLYNI